MEETGFKGKYTKPRPVVAENAGKGASPARDRVHTGLGADLRACWFFPGAAFARDGGVTDADKGFRVAAKFFY